MFLGHDPLNAHFMKYVIKIFLCLLAPAQISLPVDVKSKAATGKMLCLIQDKGSIKLHFQLMKRTVQKKYNYSFDQGSTIGVRCVRTYTYFY